MGKFRSKLKRNQKGKSWAHGQSSTSNPENMKHRMKAKSRFFQPNLSLAPPPDPNEKPSSLTLKAVYEHEARQGFLNGGKEPTVEELDLSLKSFSIDDDLMSASGLDTFKTQQTFASNYSACTNQSFSKLMNTFRANSEAHREMLAVLTAMKQIITERNGKETTTEYFLLLMETIDNAQDTSKTAACLSLLAMCIKSVPTTVLRETFSNSVETLLSLLEQFLEQEDYNSVRNTIRSICVLLRAQPYSSWSYSSTTKCVTILLQLLLHAKPKVRKSAHNAIVAIVNGSCFMKPQTADENKDDMENENENETKATQEEKLTARTHPADECIVKFCISQFESYASAKSSKNVLHCLELLKEIVNTFKADQIRAISEMILSILTTGEILIRAKSFEVLYRLFVSKNKNLNGNLCGKLLSAIYDNRPDKENVSETLRWITVLREAYVHLASVDLRLCVECLPEFLVICIRDMLPSEKHAAVTAFTLKTVLDNCVKPCCETKESSDIHRTAVLKLIKFVHKGLTSHTWNTDYMKYITLICARLFEAVGKHFGDDVKDIIVILGEQYDTQSPYRIPIEHAVLSAVKYLGPEKTLEAIPITNAKGEVRLERSWLLPILREGIQESSISFFANHILKLANDCYEKWQALHKNKDITWHSYELLFCQLWGLFPGCCRKVTDIENFKTIAKKLGMALNNNPEVRAPILDGFKQLIENKCEKCNNELSRYAKNMLPCLFNIYVAKPNGTYEADIRKKTLDVIKDYLTVAPKEVYEELFETGTTQLMSPKTEPFIKDAIFDILSLIIVVHDRKALKKFFVDFVVPILQNKKAKIFAKDEQKIQKLQRKTYCLLEQIMSSESVECQKFREKNFSAIKDLLLGSLKSSCLISQASRLKCLKLLIESSPKISVDDDLIIKTIPEILINFKNFSVKSEDIALQLLKLIGNKYKEVGKLDTFIDEVMSGMASDQLLVTNTILALGQILQNLSGSLTVTTIQFILDQILILLVQKHRGQAEASVKFLLIFIKVLPTPLVANHLEVILKSLSAMVPDTKRYCRLLVGYILKKLCKRFGAEECIKLVPGNDEVTHRRLKKIRKDLNREKRRKLENGKEEDDEDEEEVLEGLQAKSATIDDVLDDSDSDSSDEGNANDRNKNSKSKELYIQEFPEDIVDLHDMKSIGNVMTNRNARNPTVEIGNSNLTKKKDKDPNRGFKTDDDGRLIIPLDDKFKKSDSEDDDEDDDSNLGEKDEEMERVGNKSKRKFEEDSSDEDVDMSKGPSRKRKALDAKSVASGKSRGSQYQPGGKGIHRPVAASVKSGYTNLSKKSNKSAATTKAFGSEYKSRKAQGDMKKSGKLDPYAYIPLSRNVLNKRKRAKHAGQFRSIVRGMRKGIQKGAKSKASKAHKK